MNQNVHYIHVVNGHSVPHTSSTMHIVHTNNMQPTIHKGMDVITPMHGTSPIIHPNHVQHLVAQYEHQLQTSGMTSYMAPHRHVYTQPTPSFIQVPSHSMVAPTHTNTHSMPYQGPTSLVTLASSQGTIPCQSLGTRPSIGHPTSFHGGRSLVGIGVPHVQSTPSHIVASQSRHDYITHELQKAFNQLRAFYCQLAPLHHKHITTIQGVVTSVQGKCTILQYDHQPSRNQQALEFIQSIPALLYNWHKTAQYVVNCPHPLTLSVDAKHIFTITIHKSDPPHGSSMVPSSNSQLATTQATTPLVLSSVVLHSHANHNLTIDTLNNDKSDNGFSHSLHTHEHQRPCHMQSSNIRHAQHDINHDVTPHSESSYHGQQSDIGFSHFTSNSSVISNESQALLHTCESTYDSLSTQQRNAIHPNVWHGEPPHWDAMAHTQVLPHVADTNSEKKSEKTCENTSLVRQHLDHNEEMITCSPRTLTHAHDNLNSQHAPMLQSSTQCHNAHTTDSLPTHPGTIITEQLTSTHSRSLAQNKALHSSEVTPPRSSDISAHKRQSDTPMEACTPALHALQVMNESESLDDSSTPLATHTSPTLGEDITHTLPNAYIKHTSTHTPIWGGVSDSYTMPHPPQLSHMVSHILLTHHRGWYNLLQHLTRHFVSTIILTKHHAGCTSLHQHALARRPPTSAIMTWPD